jgi:hypothetical protein
MNQREPISSLAVETDFLVRGFQQAFSDDAQLAAEGYLHASKVRRGRAVLRTVIRALAAEWPRCP